MEGRVSRGRGGSWRRGGRGGNDSDGSGGEHRGRGRGGHHRGRGKRDHYRGRGRGGGADFHQRDKDEGDGLRDEEEDRMEVFSRRKLESNWDRYEESEKKEPDDDVPSQRGTDYHVLLESAGDSFTHFRFSEEKDWEMDPFAASQKSAVFVDLPALAQTLQQVPLHQRLNLEAELVQVSTPVELPSVTLVPKQEVPKTSKIAPPPASFKSLSTNQNAPVASGGSPVRSEPQVSSGAATVPPVDDGDDELDQLLSLQNPVSGAAGSQSVVGVEGERDAPQEECEEVKEEVMEEVKDKGVTPPKPSTVRKEVTEEDLEDWLDSMIS